MTGRKWVADYPVSTERQGRSGLSPDAQRRAVRAYLAGKGWPHSETASEAARSFTVVLLRKEGEHRSARSIRSRHLVRDHETHSACWRPGVHPNFERFVLTEPPIDQSQTALDPLIAMGRGAKPQRGRLDTYILKRTCCTAT